MPFPEADLSNGTQPPNESHGYNINSNGMVLPNDQPLMIESTVQMR